MPRSSPRKQSSISFEAGEQVGRRGRVRTADGLSIFDPS